MKKILFFSTALVFISLQSSAQKPEEDKSKRPSPPATASQKIESGATININYSQISLKGREIGKDVEPMEGKVWRTGANEATTFETDKDVTINGEKLPAGKYGLFTIFNGDKVTIIFNKIWEQWGAFKYDIAQDALRVTTKWDKEDTPADKMAFHIDPDGEVTLLWGDHEVEFEVK